MENDVLNGNWEPTLAERPEPFPWLNVVLFVATGFTTLFIGTMMMALFEQDPSFAPDGILRSMWMEPETLLRGLPFSVAIMSILLAHEMGHYLTCRYYGISATLPYFIPAPTMVGTFGAFIRIRSPIQHRAALLEVGVAGPIAGFVLSVPTLAIALARPRYMEIESVDGLLSLGEPLIFKIVAWLMGVVPPAGMESLLHPIGFAAWVGFLLTTLNLLPVGQLDGGHIAYALFGRFHKRISQLFLFVLLPLGIFFWPGWLVWIFLLALLGTRHPPTLDDSLPLDRRHVILGWIALAMFVLCFTPTPMTFS
jgi:membrane-associated protease RseP (regulator of RpoE activity)